ncbi:signal peptidase I [Rothia halotolerans]|uniref:signal peptidase I n=1 Tax=Rothia halotolerans TaxID=405770 RepID=UPI00101D87DA|nr:signal peptidase I [Rothia halotolerans]
MARADQHSEESPARPEPAGLWPKVKEVLLIVLYALIIAFLVKTFLFRGFYIPSGSMENTLQLNDRIFVNVAGSYFSDPERGDIIVFEDTQDWVPQGETSTNPIRSALSFVGVMPDASQNYLIKRVIGEGGDTVTCTAPDAKVQVNGQELDESPYLFPGAEACGMPFEVTVPDGEYFVMGDHRNASADSRYHIEQGTEFVSQDDVVGNASVIAWPISRWEVLDDHAEVFSDIPAASEQSGS